MFPNTSTVVASFVACAVNLPTPNNISSAPLSGDFTYRPIVPIFQDELPSSAVEPVPDGGNVNTYCNEPDESLKRHDNIEFKLECIDPVVPQVNTNLPLPAARNSESVQFIIGVAGFGTTTSEIIFTPDITNFKPPAAILDSAFKPSFVIVNR